MGAIHSEFLKLKRSLTWAIVILLPIALVISAAANTLASGEPLQNGWHTLWQRSVVFYGLFPLAIGIAILASLVWRVEHRGSNWNALMSGPTSSLRIVTAKAVVVGFLAAAMQPVMLVAILVMGKAVLGLPGMLPVQYFGISLLIMAACLPLASLQSALSMLMRSFAAPIAVGLVAAGISVAVLMLGGTAAIVSPYALVTRATQLGTGTFADTGGVTAGDVTAILTAAVVLYAAVVTVSAALLDRRDTRI